LPGCFFVIEISLSLLKNVLHTQLDNISLPVTGEGCALGVSTYLTKQAFISWEEALVKISLDFDPQIFRAYIKVLLFKEISCSALVLRVNSKFLAQYVEKNLSSKILESLNKYYSAIPSQIKIELWQEASQSTTSSSSVILKRVNGKAILFDSEGVQLNQTLHGKKLQSEKTTAPGEIFTDQLIGSESLFFGGDNLNKNNTFDNFVVGQCNLLAYESSRRISRIEEQLIFNPLYIHGGVGLGKTHLLHAIGNEFSEEATNSNKPLSIKSLPGKSFSGSALFLTAENFTNLLVRAIRSQKMEEFRNTLREVSLLLIDDIQFIAGKNRTQEEFFHTLNTLQAKRTRIIVTADRLPSQIQGLDPRIVSRLSAGLFVDVRPPDFETRLKIVRQKSSSLSSGVIRNDVAHKRDNCVVLDNKIISFIAESIDSNIRELEGAVTRILAISSLRRETPNLEIASQAVAPWSSFKRTSVNLNDIKKGVALHYSIKVSDLSSKLKTRSVTLPRQVAMYLVRKHCSLSFPEIGSAFGGRDHSSVIHSVNLISERLKGKEQELFLAIKEIEEALLLG
jgi:chromosomal replication initiator protein